MAYRIENAKCIKQTSQAILVTAPVFGKKEVWVPQSQVHEDSEVYEEGGEGTLVVSNWFAEKEGWDI